jgi:hypothetical protein
VNSLNEKVQMLKARLDEVDGKIQLEQEKGDSIKNMVEQLRHTKVIVVQQSACSNNRWY